MGITEYFRPDIPRGYHKMFDLRIIFVFDAFGVCFCDVLMRLLVVWSELIHITLSRVLGEYQLTHLEETYDDSCDPCCSFWWVALEPVG